MSSGYTAHIQPVFTGVIPKSKSFFFLLTVKVTHMSATGDGAQLLIALTLIIDISAFMTTVIAVVRPVNHSAFLIPDKFTMHRHHLSRLNRDGRGFSSVVGDQYGAAVGKLQQKSLMLQSLCIIGQKLANRRSQSHFHVTRSILLSGQNFNFAGRTGDGALQSAGARGQGHAQY